MLKLRVSFDNDDELQRFLKSLKPKIVKISQINRSKEGFHKLYLDVIYDIDGKKSIDKYSRI